jgi:hypothetical protein
MFGGSHALLIRAHKNWQIGMISSVIENSKPLFGCILDTTMILYAAPSSQAMTSARTLTVCSIIA